MRSALIVGGGVSGCSCAYFLHKRGFRVELLEREDLLGGLSATHLYHGHPYEFGPHVWFWPKPGLNEILKELTEGKLYDVDRKLYSFTDDALYRYPIHMSDIQAMKDKDKIMAELALCRGPNMKLIPEKLPKIGECSFEQYFTAALGPTLYAKFMKDYTAKMWGIPGSELSTKMVWADRIKDAYTGAPYDPLKFEDHSLGKGQPNWYPEAGWNPVWAKMTEGCEVHLGINITGPLKWTNGGQIYSTQGSVRHTWYTKDFDYIIWTLHSDEIFGHAQLPACGRIVTPIFIPESIRFGQAESIHFPDKMPLTRLTNMDRITRCAATGTLLMAEIPVGRAHMPDPVGYQFYHGRCYNQQTDEAIELHAQYVEDAQKLIPNLLFCGRHANFKYWGMPETVNAAKELCEVL